MECLERIPASKKSIPLFALYKGHLRAKSGIDFLETERNGVGEKPGFSREAWFPISNVER